MTSAFARVFCILWASGAACATAAAGPAPAVATRPDPFEKLQTLDAGRIASSWSSLPSGDGCDDGRVQIWKVR